MNFKIAHTLCSIIVISLILMTSGCGGGPGPIVNMNVVDHSKIKTKPENGKALIVFVRGAGRGIRFQSSVFDIENETPAIIGNLASVKRMVYQTDPGKHLFMVLSESADFMTATLEPNKTYYVRIVPRMGVVRTRFTLEPISSEEVNSDAFKQEFADAAWVEKNAETEAWVIENKESIERKYKIFYAKWLEKDEKSRPHLGK